MSINRNNIEAYLLDYLEGNLDPLLTAELMAFLAENPEFENLVPDSEIKHIPADSELYTEKKSLKKSFSDIPAVTESNFEEFCIASCEGLLDQKDLSRLHKYIGNDNAKQKVMDTYRMLKLSPENTILFPHKSSLKKNHGLTFGRRYLYYGLSIAASVAVILVLFFNRNIADQQPVAEILPQVTEQTDQNLKPVQVPASETIIASRPPEAELSKNQSGIDQEHALAENSSSQAEFRREQVNLTSISPLARNLDPEIPLQSDILSERKSSPSGKIPDSPGLLEDLLTADSFIGSLVSHIDFWKTAEKAISGINYLTESQLSLNRTIDENGNLTTLVVNTESYTIEGKAK